jgi:hypothetical protein
MLFKMIYHESINEFSADCKEQLRSISKPKMKKERRTIEKIVFSKLEEKFFDFTPDKDISRYIILHAYTPKGPYGKREKGKEPIFIDKEPMPCQLEEESDLFRPFFTPTEGDAKTGNPLSSIYVDVYAPIQYKKGESREIIINRYRGVITRAIEEYFQGGSKNED